MYDIILMIINRYTKIKGFKFIIKGLTAVKLTRILYKNVKYRFGLFINYKKLNSYGRRNVIA